MTQAYIDAESYRANALLRIAERQAKSKAQSGQKYTGQSPSFLAEKVKELAQIKPESKKEALASQKEYGQNWQPEQQTFSPEILDALQGLIDNQGEIDNQKRSLSNQLVALPKTQNAEHITSKILSLRENWKTLGDQVRFIKANGHLPDAPAEEGGFDANIFSANLPSDKFGLNKKMLAQREKLSKHRKRLKEAKSDSAKARQAIEVAKAEQELNLIVASFNLVK
jgi:hypothetical protein